MTMRVRSVVFDVSRFRAAIERWIDEQPEFPSRKQTQARFPKAPAKLIRAALQSCRDRQSAGGEPYRDGDGDGAPHADV